MAPVAPKVGSRHLGLKWRDRPGPPEGKRPSKMSARGYWFAPAESRVSSRAPAASPDGIVSAVIWGRSEETRLLLRGLLRLHHHPVAQEVERVEDLERLPPAPGPRILLCDVDPGTGPWTAPLAAALERHPDLRAVVILPAGARSAEPEARRAGARAVLLRPFAVRDFDAALGRAIE